jgi:hypothetical protein
MHFHSGGPANTINFFKTIFGMLNYVGEMYENAKFVKDRLTGGAATWW